MLDRAGVGNGDRERGERESKTRKGSWLCSLTRCCSSLVSSFVSPLLHRAPAMLLRWQERSRRTANGSSQKPPLPWSPSSPAKGRTKTTHPFLLFLKCKVQPFFHSHFDPQFWNCPQFPISQAPSHQRRAAIFLVEA